MPQPSPTASSYSQSCLAWSCFTVYTLLHVTVFLIGYLPTSFFICDFSLAVIAHQHHFSRPSASTAVESTAGHSVLTTFDTCCCSPFKYHTSSFGSNGHGSAPLLSQMFPHFSYWAICTLLIYFILHQPTSSHLATVLFTAPFS